MRHSVLPRPLPALLVLAVSVVLGGESGARAAQAPGATPLPTAASQPTLAVEDTMRVTFPEQFVRAPRVTLDEILRRVAEGEARRDSLMHDQSYTLIALVTYLNETDSAKPRAKLKREIARRIYKKRPDLYREIELRSRGDDNVSVETGPGMSEQIVSFAFEPRTRSRFRFRILDRTLVGNHVVYQIGFEPRSRVDVLPAGRVWIDTNEFVIVREEFWYRDRSPAPLFLKSIDSCVLERAQVDGRWWVLRRMLARVQFTSAVRLMGRVAREEVPETADLSLLLTDWQVNRGIPDSLFAGATR